MCFPSYQFKHQEFDDVKEIKEFLVKNNYYKGYPVFSPVEVIGENSHELFKNLRQQWINKLLESGNPNNDFDIKWNFGKYLVNSDGVVIKYFEPANIEPISFAEEIEKNLI